MQQVKDEVNEWCNDADGDIHLMGEAIKFYAEGSGYDLKETVAVIDSFIGHLSQMRQRLVDSFEGPSEQEIREALDFGKSAEQHLR